MQGCNALSVPSPPQHQSGVGWRHTTCARVPHAGHSRVSCPQGLHPEWCRCWWPAFGKTEAAEQIAAVGLPAAASVLRPTKAGEPCERSVSNVVCLWGDVSEDWGGSVSSTLFSETVKVEMRTASASGTNNCPNRVWNKNRECPLFWWRACIITAIASLARWIWCCWQESLHQTLQEPCC